MRMAFVPRRALIPAVLALGLMGALTVGPGPAVAQTGLTLTTPFPAVSVQPGADVSFEVTIGAAQAARVELALEGLPDGWSAVISGGGNQVHSVYVQPSAPTTVTLTISVPESAPEVVTVTLVGTAGGESARLALDLRPAEGAGGSVTMESDYPSLRGATDQAFQFNLTLRNETPQQLVFGLQASAPEGWEVTVQPSGQARAASVTVDARGEQRLEVMATAPQQAAAGTYPIAVEAVATGHSAAAELAVEITGSVQMLLTTPDERLSTTANAGAARDFEVLVLNEGTAPLSAVNLSGTGPSEWEITLEPAAIEAIPAQESATAVARITPSGNAIAGDYVVTLTAQTEGAQESVDVRVTVETAPIWGLVGLALILATLGGMFWVFQRYGRR